LIGQLSFNRFQMLILLFKTLIILNKAEIGKLTVKVSKFEFDCYHS
jgi:hypothetical protein